ncbi:MAG: discoidin domain-containing protein [Longimicrobiaceae bacterium]
MPLLLALTACAPVAIPSAEAPAVLSADASAQAGLLDDFESLEGWSAHPAEGVELRIGQDAGFQGRAMRLDFDFRGGAGYAIARRRLPVRLPYDYDFSFRIRAEAPVNNLEFKLLDPSGENVWWVNRRGFDFPGEWRPVRVRKRHLEFAWGPRGGGEPDSLSALEIVVAAGTGGKGTVWIDDLVLRPRGEPLPYVAAPEASASSSVGGAVAARAQDHDTLTAWRSAADGEQRWELDFRRGAEVGGATLHWDPLDYATAYTVETSEDGARWETAWRVEGGDGGRDPLYLPETEARRVRLRLLRSSRGRGYALREVALKPPAWSATPNAFWASLAAEAPRGAYPRYLTGEQSYWTILGVSGALREALINTDGAVETGLGGPSLEPFLYADGRLVTWGDARATQSLARGYLPVPSVEWEAGSLRLRVTAFAVGAPDASVVYARYRVENRGPEPRSVRLFLALRPFQVNPPWQFLNVPGGAARVREIAWDGEAVAVNGARTVVAVTPPGGFGATPFERGEVVEHLRVGRLPPATSAADPRGFASGALAYPLAVPAGGAREVVVAIPLQPGSPLPRAMRSEGPAEMAARLEAAVVEKWEAELGRFTLRLPAAMHGEEIANTLRTQLAYILVNRDGPSIQPGSRSYDRSWIRDGSLTSAALLRLGHPEEVKAFAEWYAPRQRASGYVPCCVSFAGADPVPEHDSHGQLVYLVAEYHRHTGDRAFLERMWPHVERAVAYIDTLRHERMTPEYRAPEKRAFYGMLPQSISHEGYSAKPMHSYWDDFFAYRGLDDAVYVAGALGRAADRARFAAVRDAFRRDLLASLRLSMAAHGIGFLPGSVELGDFDATSTTVALVPGGLEAELPRDALLATFERYYRESIRARREGGAWDAYTPYEWRTVGTFVRLGWKERAHEAIDLFFGHRRPAAWNQWAEVVFRDPKTPKFIGDMPHTWVGSDFIRSVLDLFAYERAPDGALVVGAGIPAAWAAEAPGVAVERLRTHYGPLDLRVRAEGTTVRVNVGGAGLRVPPGGVVVRSPLDRPIRRATVNGRAVRPGDHEITVRRIPAEIVLEH